MFKIKKLLFNKKKKNYFIKCNKCNNGNMIIKLGQYGLFAACDNFPKCKNTIKLNKFIYEVLKKDGINIYGWDTNCYRCGKKTKVYTYFLNKQLKPYMEKYTELGNIGLDSIKKIDDFLKNNYQTINRNFSKTQHKYCTSNNCMNCNSLIGNYFVVDDPHDIFDDWIRSNMDKYIVDNIKIQQINLKEEDLLGFEDDYGQVFDD